MVDLWVKENISLDNELKKEDRVALINLMNYECSIEDKNYSILNAIDIMIASYTAACSKKDYRLLKIPKLKELEYHFYE